MPSGRHALGRLGPLSVEVVRSSEVFSGLRTGCLLSREWDKRPAGALKRGPDELLVRGGDCVDLWPGWRCCFSDGARSRDEFCYRVEWKYGWMNRRYLAERVSKKCSFRLAKKAPNRGMAVDYFPACQKVAVRHDRSVDTAIINGTGRCQRMR